MVAVAAIVGSGWALVFVDVAWVVGSGWAVLIDPAEVVDSRWADAVVPDWEVIPESKSQKKSKSSKESWSPEGYHHFFERAGIFWLYVV